MQCTYEDQRHQARAVNGEESIGATLFLVFVDTLECRTIVGAADDQDQQRPQIGEIASRADGPAKMMPLMNNR